MAALRFKYLDVAVQVNRGKVAHSPEVGDIGINLKGTGSAIQEIVPLVLDKPTQNTQHSPAKKHNAENTAEPEQPVLPLRCDRLWLWRWLSSWRQPMMDNNALVSLLDHLIPGCGVADRATCGSYWIVSFVFL